ncbi:hypothetical protein F4811DRAFT_481287 [Daldinia bambusicola]|nr:hypothetical protein F4811DRAFT_481287 [Daldinia bambusicola]
MDSFQRAHRYIVLVTPRSATRGLLESNESLTFPLNENHSNIVKFQPGHEDYSVVVGRSVRISNIEPMNAIILRADRNQSSKTIADLIRSEVQGHNVFTASEDSKARGWLFNEQDEETFDKLIEFSPST